MDGEKVVEIRQQLFDVAESIMGARNLAGLLALKSVTIESVRNKIRDADVALMKVWDALSNEDGMTTLELVLYSLLAVVIVLAVFVCVFACFALPEL